MHCDLDLGGMTLGKGHDTPLGHGQQLCEILSRSDKGVKSYGLTRCEQTDGRTDRQTGVIPIYPQTLFAGVKNMILPEVLCSHRMLDYF